MKRLVSILLVIMLLVPAAGALAASQYATITVKDAETGAGIQGADVKIYQLVGNTKKYITTSVTDRNGNVKRKLSPGTYTAMLKRTPFGYKTASSINFTVYSWKDTSTAFSLVPKPGKIVVTVTDAKSKKPVGIQLTIKNSKGNTVKAASVSKTNSSTGQVSFPDLKQGTYSIYLSDGKYVKTLARKVTITPGETKSVSFTATPVYTVKFKIVDRAGRVVKSANVGVTVSRQGYTDLFARVDTTGVATVYNVPYGTSTVTVALHGAYATEKLYSGSMTFSADKPGSTINKKIKVK